MNINKDAKRIMIYGDSYTFGKVPGVDERYDTETRYTGVLQKKLGENFEIIEEGLRGRTIEGENKFFPYRNGFTQFGPIFGSHLPIDLLILLLGTNNINSKSDEPLERAVKGYKSYLERIQWWSEHLKFNEPKIMLIAPPIISERDSYALFGDMFKGSESKSRKLVKLIEKFAKSNRLLFFESSKIIKVSNVDGVHLDQENNNILGNSLASAISTLWH